MGTMNRIGLLIEPMDVLAFRDGRPFGAGSNAKSGLPLPQALAGSLRTALLGKFGCDFRKLGAQVRQGARFEEAIAASGAPSWIAGLAARGPWLARQNQNSAIEIFLPAPSTLQREKDGPGSTLLALQPLQERVAAPGWRPLEGEKGMRPLWSSTAARLERAGEHLALAGVAAFLAGEPVDALHLAPAGGEAPLFDYDERTGIGIDPERLSAEESLIYSIGYLSLDHRNRTCFYAEALLPEHASPEVFDGIAWVGFGGEGRKARLKRIAPMAWPQRTPSRPDHKPMLLMTTPAVFSDTWRPAVLAGKLAGVSVPGYIPISGWDLARRGPKQTRFAVPAGSVFFLGDTTQNLPDTLAENDEDRLSGYGCYLKGVWSDD